MGEQKDNKYGCIIILLFAVFFPVTFGIIVVLWPEITEHRETFHI